MAYSIQKKVANTLNSLLTYNLPLTSFWSSFILTFHCDLFDLKKDDSLVLNVASKNDGDKNEHVFVFIDFRSITSS